MNLRLRHLTLAALALASSSALAQTYKPKPLVASSTDVLVRVVPGTNTKILDAAIGAVEVSSMPQIGWRTVRVSASYGVTRALNYYLSNSKVLEASAVYKNEAFAVVNDPAYRNQYSPTIMKVPTAWDTTIGAVGTKIAILDTSFDLKHEEFQNGKMLVGYDFSDNDDDVNPTEKTDNHGTHVAGIAAATTNNSRGIAGMGYNCSILPYKVFPNSYDDVVAKAVISAADKGAAVISMSLGRFGAPNAAFQAAVNYATSKGSVVIAAAGNENTNIDIQPSYPASYTNVICVGSSDSGDRRSGFSNFGNRVDVAAPGSSIYSTVQGGYEYFDGTSMATPNVAGVIGLMRTYAPKATPAQIRLALMKSTDYIGTWLATGRVNATKALTLLRPATPISSTRVASGKYGTTMTTTDLAKLATSGDGQTVPVPMTFTRGLGQSAEYVMQFKTPTAPYWPDYVESSVTVNAKINAPSSTTQVYLWDYTSKSYKLVSQGTTTTSMVVKLPLNQSQYRTSNGQYQVMVRGLVPIRSGNPTSGGVMTLDVLTSSTSFRQAIEE